MINLMVIVPHEDDDLPVAGQLIYETIQQGRSMKVVFTTNGDYYPKEAEIRHREAIAALGVLGVKREDILFLGYGDSMCDETRTTHIYNLGDDIIAPAFSGHRETYGSAYAQDYCYTRHGVHHSYCKSNFRYDLKEVISEYLPQLIVTTGWDTHEDHIMLCLMMDEVMREILAEDESYHPIVLQGQAYNGKWEGHPDYHTEYNYTERVNESRGIPRDYPLNKWENRLRFEVPKVCITRRVKRNLLYKAAKEYKSQSADLKVIRFANRDVVYWLRRMDSLGVGATYEASSGEPEYLHDFKCVDCGQILGDIYDYSKTPSWIPSESDSEKYVTITLKNPAVLKEIVVYPNQEPNCAIEELQVTLLEEGSQGICATYTMGPLNQDGFPEKLLIDFDGETTGVKLQIKKATGSMAGIAEVELFSTETPEHMDVIALKKLEEETQKSDCCGAFAARMESWYFRVVEYGRVRFWPYKYFLMKKYPHLNEKDGVFKFWHYHFKTFFEQIFGKLGVGK